MYKLEEDVLKIKNDVLFNKEFSDSLVKLSKCSFKDITLTIKIAKLIKTIQEESEVVFPIRNNLLTEYKVSVAGNKISSEAPVEKLEEFNQKLIKLAQAEFDTPLDNKIEVSEEMSGIIDASDILALESVLTY